MSRTRSAARAIRVDQRRLSSVRGTVVAFGALAAVSGWGPPPPRSPAPYVVVLGIAQDGGVPQAGGPERGLVRRVVSLGLVDPATNQRWLIEATPDFREQLRLLDSLASLGTTPTPGLDGVFLTHAHMGHYTGLMFLGHESMGAQGVPVYAMPRMAAYLEQNGPWSQLVELGNIDLRLVESGVPVRLNDRLSVTPLEVPHRQEYAEVVGYRIDGPDRSILFIPDIDSWNEWDARGVSVEALIATVDVAYLDGSFYADGEVGGRDMSGFPHPLITTSMARFESLPASERAKVRFIHLNHTNPALYSDSEARLAIETAGYGVAEELEREAL